METLGKFSPCRPPELPKSNRIEGKPVIDRTSDVSSFFLETRKTTPGIASWPMPSFTASSARASVRKKSAVRWGSSDKQRKADELD